MLINKSKKPTLSAKWRTLAVAVMLAGTLSPYGQLVCFAQDPQVKSDWAVDEVPKAKQNPENSLTPSTEQTIRSGTGEQSAGNATTGGATNVGETATAGADIKSGNSLGSPSSNSAAGSSSSPNLNGSSGTSAAADIPMVVPVVSPATKAVIETESKKPAVEAQKTTAPSTVIKAGTSSARLFGRIEQITSGKGANFPIVFKAATPSLDTSLTASALKGQAQDITMYSGTVAKSFPEDYRGTWGGSLKVWTLEQAPICFQIDPEEASKVQRIFTNKAEGSVNFMFANDTKGGIYLAPAQIMFQVPGKAVDLDKQMTQMMGGQSLASMGPMGQMMAQMANSMPVPIIFAFGDLQTSSMAKGLSGNEFVQRTMRNTVRQLSKDVIEQQIIAQMNEVMKATGRPRVRYEESVIRFTKVNPQQMYVQAAQVVYGPDRKFQQKIVMYGYVTRGQVVNTNPYSGIMQMPGLPGMTPGSQPSGGFPQINPGSIPGLTPGQNPFGNGGSIPGLPPGFNPFQGLFGQ